MPTMHELFDGSDTDLIPTHDQMATAYYKAGMLKQAPPWVPSRVRVLREQYGDGPFRGAGVPAGEYDCRCNKWGAVSVLARDGKPLGLRLDEFEPLAWRENVTPNVQLEGRENRRRSRLLERPTRSVC